MISVTVEKLAAIIADAFGPAFSAAATRPGHPVKVPVPYEQLPERSKDIFREVAVAVLSKERDWHP